MRLFAMALGLALALLTGGCLVETENTLGDPDAQSIDPRLVGTWSAVEDRETTVIVAAPDAKTPGAYSVVFATIRPDREKPVDYTLYGAWRTVIGGQSYLNIRQKGDAGAGPASMIATYDLDGDGRLVLRLMDSKFVAAAVKAGRLKGAVKSNDAVTITASRAELAAFIADSPRDALFATKTGPLTRLAETRP